MFIEGETVILNQSAKSGLPMRVGEKCEIVENLYSYALYDYRVVFDDGEFAKVKESELNKLTDNQKELITYIYQGNTVRIKSSGEIAKILKVDYLLNQAEIMFLSDGAIVVVMFISLEEDEYDSIGETHDINETRIDRHRNVIEEIHKTFIQKNADYGNSFGEQYEEYGLLSALIRLDDKMRRLKQLLKQDAQVKDESIRDTVLDLANYAIMTVMELDKEGR